MYLFTYSDTFLSASWPSLDEVYQGRLTTEKRKALSGNYASEVQALQSFALSLKFVKKALANVSTLMIFDDHDITDDWFISKEWSETALMKDSTSSRYILNGLLAYVLFQDWGNDYTKYTSGAGKKILDALHIKSTSYLNNQTEAIEKILLPQVINDGNTQNPSHYLQSDFSWHHQIEYTAFKIVLLNTRTERQFYKNESPLGNLIRNSSAQLGRIPGEKIFILVSATPVFGNILMEAGQEKLREGRIDQLSGLGSKIKGLTGMYPKDQEAWSFSNQGFSRLLFLLSHCPKVLILSGDVHYAFTSYIRLWRKGAHALSEIVQSTSSSLKNSAENTHLPVTGITDRKLLKIIPFGLKVKPDISYKMLKVLGRKNFKQTPLFAYNNPRFEYMENLIFRNRLSIPGVRLSGALQFIVRYINSKSYSLTHPLFQKIMKTAQSHVYKEKIPNGPVSTTVVGKDNISLISFSANAIVNTIWMANGTPQKPDDSESRRMMFPFITHQVVWHQQFKTDELPLNEFKKRLGKTIEVQVE